MRCIAIRKDGEQCRVPFGMDKEGRCWHHSLIHAEERRRASSQGGKVTAAKRRKFSQRTIHPSEAEAPPETAAEAAAWSSWTVWAVACGVVDKSTAREINHGVRTFLAALEKSEVEAKISELEGQVKELRGERPILKRG